MRILSTILLLLFITIRIFAGGPRTPILAVCEVQTSDSNTRQGILILYGGGWHGFYPNGLYFSDNIDTCFSSGTFHFYNINLRGIDFKTDIYRGKTVNFIYNINPFSKSKIKYEIDTINNEDSLFSLNFKNDPLVYFSRNVITNYGSDKKMYIIPSEIKFDLYYEINDSLQLFSDLCIDPECGIIVPLESSSYKIPLNRITKIIILANPNETWLDKIRVMQLQKPIFKTYWLHEIILSKKNWKNIQKDIKTINENNGW